MKNYPLAFCMALLLLLLAVSTVTLSYISIADQREIPVLERSVNQAYQQINVMQALVSETTEYAKKNPAIEPILQDIATKSRAISQQNGAAHPPAP